MEVGCIGEEGKDAFLEVLRDLNGCIGIAAGLTSPKLFRNHQLQPKPWTGKEEDPVYVFHVSQKLGKERQRLDFGSRLVQVTDNEEGDYVSQLRAEKPRETHNIVGVFALPDIESAAFIEELQGQYGKAIDDLLTGQFRSAFEFGKAQAFKDVIDVTGVQNSAYRLPLVRKLYREVGYDISSIIKQAIDIGVHYGVSGKKKGFIQ